jgi:hypothetical protein
MSSGSEKHRNGGFCLLKVTKTILEYIFYVGVILTAILLLLEAIIPQVLRVMALLGL